MADGDRRSPLAALVLSLIPGAGHIYAGRVGSGVLWLIALFMAYQMRPEFAVIVHVVCALSAARAAQAANRAEAATMARRRESASEVAGILDRVGAELESGVKAPPPGPPGRDFEADPPPRLVRAAFPVEPALLLDALSGALERAGLRVLGVDRSRHRIRAEEPLGRGLSASIVAQVEPTPTGARVRMILDRPPGAPRNPDADDARLREILGEAEARLSREAPGDARPVVAVGESEALTEDHFLEHLREAWESREQGWIPDSEWEARRSGLLAGVTLRPDTRLSDFLAACGPLVEAGILEPEDLLTLESHLRS